MCTKSARQCTLYTNETFWREVPQFNDNQYPLKLHIVEDERKFLLIVKTKPNKLVTFLVSGVNIQKLYRLILLTACYVFITCLV